MSFFLGAIFAITFQACRKEAFTEQLSSSSALKNPITSDAAKAWFQNKFGETKLISPNSIASSSDTLDGYYFDASYEITPLWSESKIAAFLQTNPILLVPVKPIPFLDAKGHHYTLVFFRDSLNQLDARLQVYQATPEYAKNNPKFKVENFTGFFYQIHLTGKVDKVCGVEQGKFTYKIQLKPKEKTRIIKIQTRSFCDGCFSEDHTATLWNKFRCNVLCAVFDGGGTYDGGGADTYINVGADGSWLGLGSTNDYTNDPPTYSGDPTSGSGGTFENNNPNTVTNPNYLAGELGNEIFDLTEERATLLAINRRLNMNIEETDFLKNNRQAALQIESYLLSKTTIEGTDNARAHLTSLMSNAAYRLANQQAAYVATIIETLGKYTKAGFMAEEFAGLYADKPFFQQVDKFLSGRGFSSQAVLAVKSPAVLSIVLTFIQKSTASEAEKNAALNDYIKNLNFNETGKGGDINGNNGGDPRLDLSALLINPNFRVLNTLSIREKVKNFNSNLEDWKINISAGVALENAYAEFAGYGKGWNMLATPSVGPMIRLTRPDFIHKTEYIDVSNGKKINFGLGGIVEVKAPGGTISLSTNNYQIAAEIAFAQYARGDDGNILATFAYEKKAGAYTLVVPYGTVIDPNIVQECTKSNVNFYISYAFESIDGNKVIFSNPQRQNFISNEKSPSPGNLNNPIALDLQRATVYWDTSNNSKDE